MVHCPKCGAELVNGANFCFNCGLPLVQMPSAQDYPAQTQDYPAQTPSYQPPAQDYPAPSYQPPAQEYQVPPQDYQQPQGYPGSSVRIIANGDPDPLFRCQCEYCMCTFEYHIRDLGYRAWYPHGFVYCPRCRRPLRHRLEYRV